MSYREVTAEGDIPVTDTTGTATAAGSGVQSIDRATAILAAFSYTRPILGVTEISELTGLATSTVHRLLSALEHNRLIRRSGDRQYALGPLLLQLAHQAATHASLRDIALPTMQALRDSAEETVGLHELVGHMDRATIAQAESRLALRRTYTDLGVPIPLPQGAPGKALLAFLPDAQQERILAGPLVAVTELTITDPANLRAQLNEVRRVGFAISLGERTPGIRSVAAPIWDQTGHASACLSISAPELRMRIERCRELGTKVKEAAWKISETLGATASEIAANLPTVT